MAKPTTNKRGNRSPPNPGDLLAFDRWLSQRPRPWSVVIANRAALRVLPLLQYEQQFPVLVLSVLRAIAISRVAARFPNVTIDPKAADAAYRAVVQTKKMPNDLADILYGTCNAAATAAHTLAFPNFGNAAAGAAAYAAFAASESKLRLYSSVEDDVQKLHQEAMGPEILASTQLWPISAPTNVSNAYSTFSHRLLALGTHWQVWLEWYETLVLGEPFRVKTEAWYAAFTDVPSELPWDDGPEVVNTEIARRLAALRLDPVPVEGIPSPIAINIRSDGRIGADAGAFATPTVPPSRSLADHAHALSACRNLAERLGALASSPQFNGRRDYGEALSAYLEWLPTESGSGNILLADSEARVLTKLFIADEGILAEGFASRLSVFLENHIAARAFYPEVALHYQSIRTGHIATPLPHDAVEGIRETIRAHSPKVFDQTVPPVLDEAAKPVPDARPPAPADAPPPDPSRPRPPKDPIADADPAASRNTIFARVANRVWQVLRDGKDLPQVIDGWGKAYDQLKPYIGPIIEWLKTNMPGGSDGMPPAPPPIGV